MVTAASVTADGNAAASSSSQDVKDEALRSYWASRSTLIAQEQSLRFDSVKSSSLTPLEQKASSLLSSVRDSERTSIYDNPDDPSAQPGMPFRGALARGMRSTSTWRILSRMPKGAALHCHMDGTVPAPWLITEAVQRYGDVIHMRADQALDKVEKLYSAGVQFQAKAKEDVVAGDIYSPQYDGTTQWMSLNEARATFPFADVYEVPPTGYTRGIDIPLSANSSRNAAAFDSYLHSLMTLSPATGSPSTATSRQAWSRFLSTFGIIGGFVSYLPLLRSYLKQMCKVHARDGVQYMEARTNFFEEHYIAEDGKTPVAHAQWCRVFKEAVQEARRELREEEGIETFLDARIIYCTVRIITPERLRWYLDDCIALKREFGRLIVGFDLVGHEDPGVTLKEYAPELLRFQQQCRTIGLSIPFLFHAGETLLDGSPADSNLYDALLLGTRRIGHGFSLARHPHLIQLCKERGVCIEVCPVSNEALGYTGCMAGHPLPVLMNSGVDVALSNDDATQFGNEGLTYDIYQYFTSSYSASLASLYSLVRASLRHACLDDDDDDSHRDGSRRKHEALFEREWEKWCQWIVDECETGTVAGGEPPKKAMKMDGQQNGSANGEM